MANKNRFPDSWAPDDLIRLIRYIQLKIGVSGTGGGSVIQNITNIVKDGVEKIGLPGANQIALWNDENTIKALAALAYDPATSKLFGVHIVDAQGNPLYLLGSSVVLDAGTGDPVRLENMADPENDNDGVNRHFVEKILNSFLSGKASFNLPLATSVYFQLTPSDGQVVSFHAQYVGGALIWSLGSATDFIQSANGKLTIRAKSPQPIHLEGDYIWVEKSFNSAPAPIKNVAHPIDDNDAVNRYFLKMQWRRVYYNWGLIDGVYAGDILPPWPILERQAEYLSGGAYCNNGSVTFVVELKTWNELTIKSFTRTVTAGDDTGVFGVTNFFDALPPIGSRLHLRIENITGTPTIFSLKIAQSVPLQTFIED